MKKNISLLLVLFLLCVVNICFSQGLMFSKTPAKAKAADTQPDSYTWDFGSVKEGELLKHEFILKNGSQRNLKITGINTSCGCTASSVKNKLLGPGDETTVEVTFDSKGYSGNVTQYVYLNTESLDKPIIRFIIKANVVK